MEPYLLKVKFGVHEFEAEGPAEVVQAQFAQFKELVASAPSLPQPTPEQAVEVNPTPNQAANQTAHIPLERILKTEGRVVSLTAKCDTVDEAILLILLGQKEMRGNQEVSGAEIMDGLTQSGYRLSRVDHQMNKLEADGNTMTMGVHRGRRYRLSNAGLSKALAVARELIATVP